MSISKKINSFLIPEGLGDKIFGRFYDSVHPHRWENGTLMPTEEVKNEHRRYDFLKLILLPGSGFKYAHDIMQERAQMKLQEIKEPKPFIDYIPVGATSSLDRDNLGDIGLVLFPFLDLAKLGISGTLIYGTITNII